ncbi:MAG TPA: TonB family protein [Polyangia bacterium]|nr:TonB family protein [Polyangia bacterium]
MPDSFTRRIVPLTALALATITGAVSMTGCATDDEAARAAAEQERFAQAARGGDAPTKRARLAADIDPSMKLDNEMGVLETADVEDALQARFDDVRACYERAGKAREYAGGRVLLHFLVDGAGHAEDVWVVESSLGNYDVERCLVEVGRSVVFQAPSGHKATTFDYPVEFRSTHEVAVLDVDGLKIDHDLATFLPQLAPCGRLAQEPVNAIMYIEPTGFPGSVGLAASGALDEAAAECAVRTIQKWKMSATLPGKMLRANFSIPAYLASAEAPPRRAASSASGRRRHR